MSGTAVVLALLLGLALQPAFVESFGMKKDPPPKAPIVNSDIKFIRCQVGSQGSDDHSCRRTSPEPSNAGLQ